MTKPIARYFQTCDFCHKEVETNVAGLPDIKLPGYYIKERGAKNQSIVSGAICSECMDKLRDLLGQFIDLKEVEYVGNVFKWVEEAEERQMELERRLKF